MTEILNNIDPALVERALKAVVSLEKGFTVIFITVGALVFFAIFALVLSVADIIKDKRHGTEN